MASGVPLLLQLVEPRHLLHVYTVGSLHFQDALFLGELRAAFLVGSVPVALLYSFFMDYFVSGLTAGALKG